MMWAYLAFAAALIAATALLITSPRTSTGFVDHALQALGWNWAVALFLGYAGVSIVGNIWSTLPTCLDGDGGHGCTVIFAGALGWLGIVVAFFLTSTGIRIDTRLLERIVFTAAIGYLFVVFVLLILGDYNRAIGGDGRFRLAITRFEGANSNQALVFYLMTMAFAASRTPTPLTICAIVSSGILAGLTNSYAGYLSAACLCGAVMFFTRDGRRALLVLASVVIGAVLAWLLSEEPSIKTASTTTRVKIYTSFAEIFRASPVFGIGFAGVSPIEVTLEHANDKVRTFYNAHSVILHALVQGGVVGFLLFAVAALHTAWRGFRLAMSGHPLAMLMIVAAVPVAFFQKGPLFTVPGATWLLVWVPMLIVVALSQKNRAVTDTSPGEPVLE